MEKREVQVWVELGQGRADEPPASRESRRPRGQSRAGLHPRRPRACRLCFFFKIYLFIFSFLLECSCFTLLC